VGVETLIAFFLTSLAIELTPGPNMAYLAVVGVSRGRAPGLYAVAGVAFGLALLGLAAGFGLGQFILENQLIYETLRWGGAIYLLWLAYDAWREGQEPLEVGDTALSGLRFFQRGFVTNLLNPKAALFYVAVLPGFVDETVPLGGQLIVLVAIHVGAATLVHAAIVLLSSRLQPFFERPAWRRWTGLFFALILIGVAVWLLVKTAS
jgi:threonine/homoserine/homoserine lactone efflux protein